MTSFNLFIFIATVALMLNAESNSEVVKKEEMQKFGWKDTSDQGMADLNRMLTKYQITTNLRLWHFLSQVGHESQLGKYTKEAGDQTYCTKHYENRKDLGNTEPGDGCKFKGAGYLQLTGRNNYQKFSNYIVDLNVMDGVDYVSVKYPWECAGYWWKNNNMNALCDKTPTVEEVTQKVNGGQNGIDSRKKYYEKIKTIIDVGK